MKVELETRTISLEVACSCSAEKFAAALLEQLSRGYERCSVLELPDTIDEWRDAHRTARKRASRARRLGYVFGYVDREQRADEIFAVNTSLDERQGRPMSSGYTERPRFGPEPDYGCANARHGIRCYGVSDRESGVLVAYLWLYRAGELALVSSILGHGDHLRGDVMYELVEGAIAEEIVERDAVDAGDVVLVYNRHDSGTEGLRYFKERLGFREERVEWRP